MNDQCYLNGGSKSLDWKVGNEGFAALLRKHLQQFPAVVDEMTLAAIEVMRQRVNNMKHIPTFHDASLVSRSDYEVAAGPIADFWNQLMNQRLYIKMDWNEHLERHLAETV